MCSVFPMYPHITTCTRACVHRHTYPGFSLSFISPGFFFFGSTPYKALHGHLPGDSREIRCVKGKKENKWEADQV